MVLIEGLAGKREMRDWGAGGGEIDEIEAEAGRRLHVCFCGRLG